MKNENLLQQVNEVFKDVLDDPAIVLTENTTSDDVDEWDSLTHIQLIVAIEKHFKIKFLSSEIRNWKNVGEMLACIASK